MVRRVSKNGAVWEKPPYTEEEERDFYRRVGGGPKTVVHRPAPAPEVPPPALISPGDKSQVVNAGEAKTRHRSEAPTVASSRWPAPRGVGVI
jgi:hypothetical protein